MRARRAHGDLELEAKPRHRREPHLLESLQRDVGNRAVAQLVPGLPVQRAGLMSSARETFHEFIGKKTNAEQTGSDISGELESVLDTIGRMRKASWIVPAVDDHLETMEDALGKVSGPLAKAVAGMETAREVDDFLQACKALEGLDINANPQEAADALGKLAMAAGSLGERALPEEAGGVGAYLQIIKRSGEVFQAGARLRATTEGKLDPDKWFADRASKLADSPRPAAADEVAWDDVGVYCVNAVEQAKQEVAAVNQPWASAGWSIYIRRLLGAFDQFVPMNAYRGGIPDLPIGAQAQLKRERKRELWFEVRTALLDLEHWVGRAPDTTVSFQGPLRAWDKVKP